MIEERTRITSGNVFARRAANRSTSKTGYCSVDTQRLGKTAFFHGEMIGMRCVEGGNSVRCRRCGERG